MNNNVNDMEAFCMSEPNKYTGLRFEVANHIIFDRVTKQGYPVAASDTTVSSLCDLLNRLVKRDAECARLEDAERKCRNSVAEVYSRFPNVASYIKRLEDDLQKDRPAWVDEILLAVRSVQPPPTFNPHIPYGPGTIKMSP